MNRDDLIQNGLEGKSSAIAAYDEMLWKIRAGYAAILYGVFTLVVGLADKTKWPFSTESISWVAIMLVTGFTLAASVMDWSVLRSKFRVIQAREELVDFALRLTAGGNLDEGGSVSLNTLLHNSGEGRAPIQWNKRCSIVPIVLMYLLSWLPLLVAIVGLTQPWNLACNDSPGG